MTNNQLEIIERNTMMDISGRVIKWKKIAVLILFIVIVIYSTVDTLLPHDGKYNVQVNAYKNNNMPQFLSDEYFNELDKLYIRIKNEKGQKGIAAQTVLNQMMDDLENNPDTLADHKNFKRFFEIFDKNIRESDIITERMHFFRNTLNSYSGAPIKLESMIDLAARDKWYLFSAKFHRYNYGDVNGALNVKFLSADSRFEAVYNTETGKIVTDPANMGTYNYAPGSFNPVMFYYHSKYDKDPWKKWGNIKGFSYKDIMSLKSGNGTAEAKKNNKKIEKWIKQRKEELGY